MHKLLNLDYCIPFVESRKTYTQTCDQSSDLQDILGLARQRLARKSAKVIWLPAVEEMIC